MLEFYDNYNMDVEMLITLINFNLGLTVENNVQTIKNDDEWTKKINTITKALYLNICKNMN